MASSPSSCSIPISWASMWECVRGPPLHHVYPTPKYNPRNPIIPLLSISFFLCISFLQSFPTHPQPFLSSLSITTLSPSTILLLPPHFLFYQVVGAHRRAEDGHGLCLAGHPVCGTGVRRGWTSLVVVVVLEEGQKGTHVTKTLCEWRG